MTTILLPDRKFSQNSKQWPRELPQNQYQNQRILATLHNFGKTSLLEFMLGFQFFSSKTFLLTWIKTKESTKQNFQKIKEFMMFFILKNSICLYLSIEY